MAEKRYILGIDAGTQSVKAGLVRMGGMNLEFMAAREYPGKALQDADVLWAKTAEAVRELADRLPAGGMIEGVGLSGQMHGTVLYDAAGGALGPVINWQDERGNEPRAEFGGGTAVREINRLIPCEVFDDLGIDVMASGFMGATLFHIMKTDPEFFSKISRAVFPTDYIRRRLLDGGPYSTDPTNAFSSGLFDTRRGEWSREAIDALGLPFEIFPEVRPTEEKAGGVGPEAARLTGLAQGTPVVHGGGDNQMSLIGSGVISPDSPALVNIGTGSQVCAVTDEYVKIPGIDTRSFIHEKYVFAGAALTGGAALTWFRNSLLSDLADPGIEYEGRGGLFALLDRLAESAPRGCGGLRFEPLLRGTRRSPDLRASFSGISRDNYSLGFRARAVMEGVVRELLDFFKKFEGVRAVELVGAGNGLVKSALWRNIAAREFGMPLQVTDFENAVYGAALVAVEGLGFGSLSDCSIEYTQVAQP